MKNRSKVRRAHHGRALLALLVALLLAGCALPIGGTGVPGPDELQAVAAQTQQVLAQAQEEIAAAEEQVAVEVTNPIYLAARDESTAAAPYLTAGLALYDKGDLEAALAEFQRAVAADPERPEPYLAVGLIYLSMGEYEAALVEYTAALEVDPSLVFTYVQVGVAHFNLNDTTAALEAFNTAIELDPDEMRAYYFRGWILAIQGDLEASLVDLDRAVALAPEIPDNLALRMRVLWFTDQNAAAAVDADSFLGLADGGAVLEAWDAELAYIVRATQRMVETDLSGAVADWQAALRLNPWNTQLYAQLMQVQAIAEHYEARAAHYEQLAAGRRSPGSADFVAGMQHLLQAQLLNIPGAADAAVADFNVVIAADPEWVEAYHGRAVAQVLVGRIVDAGGYNVSFEGDTVTYDDPITGETVIKTQEEYDADRAAEEEAAAAGREAAITDLNQALALDPTSAPVLHDLGVVLFAGQSSLLPGMPFVEPTAESRDRALDLLAQAVQADPDWPQARLSRMLALLHWGVDAGREAAGPTPVIKDLAYAPDGATLVTAGDHRFDIWDTATGKRLQSFPAAGPQPDRNDATNSNYTVTFNPDGSLLATTGHDDAAVHLLDAASGEPRRVFAEQAGFVQDVQFSPDGALLAAANDSNEDPLVRVWQAESGDTVYELAGDPPLVFTPDGRYLIAGGQGPHLSVWNLQSGEQAALLAGSGETEPDPDYERRYEPRAIVVRPDSKQVAAVSNYGALRVWPLGEVDGIIDARVLREATNSLYDRVLAYGVDAGTLFVTLDGHTSRVDVASGEEIDAFGDDETIHMLVVDAQVSSLATVESNGEVTLRDVQDGTPLQLLKLEKSATQQAAQTRTLDLLQTALAEAEILIEQYAGVGWPYFVRMMTKSQLAQMDATELVDADTAQIEADWATFQRLSPDVRLDDVLYESLNAIQLSGSTPLSPLTAGRIEEGPQENGGGRVYVLAQAGFSLAMPPQADIRGIRDANVPDGPAFVSIFDDFRRFDLIAMPVELGNRSAAEWLRQELGAFGLTEFTFLDPRQTPNGEATLAHLPETGALVAVLPVDDRIFYFEFTKGGSGAMMMQDLGIEPNLERDVGTLGDFVAGLTLLRE